MLKIQLISGVVQVIPSSLLIYQLTKKQKNLTLLLSSLVKYCGISTRKKNAMILLEPGKKLFRNPTLKRTTF